MQDVVELSNDQKVALVAARRKLMSTVEDINLQRKQVPARREWRARLCVKRCVSLHAQHGISVERLRQYGETKFVSAPSLDGVALVWLADSAGRAGGVRRNRAALWSPDIGVRGADASGNACLRACLPGSHQ